jgi:hypothetical protein
MNVQMAPAVQELIARMPDVDWSAWRGGTTQIAGWCPLLRPVKHGKLWLTRGDPAVDLQKYMELNRIQSEDEAATDIELRANRVEVVSSFEHPRVTDVREVLLRVLQSFPLMLDALTENFSGKSWVLWANIQFHLGEFDEEPGQVSKVRSEDLICNVAGWWFMADVSFAERRPSADGFLSERVSRSWGETLSPLQILCFQ